MNLSSMIREMNSQSDFDQAKQQLIDGGFNPTPEHITQRKLANLDSRHAKYGYPTSLSE